MSGPDLILTICITTYNRADKTINLLKRLTYRPDVEYLLVDDGSEETVSHKISSFINAETLPVKYFRKENGGKVSGLLLGLKEAKGKYFADLDSDDFVSETNLNNLLSGIARLENLNAGRTEPIVGICGLCEYTNGEIIGNSFPQDEYSTTYLGMRIDDRVRGDKAEVILTERLQEIPIQVTKGEKRIPSSVLWRSLGKDQLLFLNKVFNIYDVTGDDRLSNNIFRRMIASPNSTRLNCKVAIVNSSSYSSKLFLIKSAFDYFRFTFHGARPFIGKEVFVGSKLLLLLVLPFSFFMFLGDRIRTI